ncbi:NAD(P)H-quinone oxidoreductase [Halomonas llamarensis]|uniref:NAD(P)H-quinone oxidoreductase n=1 Tax=Halomonas llamarensis TaxID=2945104 RepID=A0ABT0SPF1_9GAMM|nr:NAD(P)H-quinone oxidoreductase [Halomonas llamarensis]MCL7929611.1 NAD(P)H-quinone oxidoreductase [Halomonas llamarensis]
MYAVEFADQNAYWQKTATPSGPDTDEVRLRVAWAGVNRADLMQRAGHYPPPPGVTGTLGLEVSGTITHVGDNVTHLKPGDDVCALLAGGGYAEEVVVDARQVLPLPEGISLREGAALPEVFATAWLNLFMEGALQQGERVLLHAGASGVGTAAIQLCRAFGHPCFVTVGSQEKLQACRKLGASDGWNRHDGSFVEAVKAWGGADAILDPVGASYLADNQKVLNADGRLVLIGIMGGRSATLDMSRMLMKRQRFIGSTLRAKSAAAKGEIMDALYQYVWPRIANSEITSQIDRSWPIQAVDEAHAYMRKDANTGKILLAVTADAD